MTSLKIFAAALILSTASATTAFAQAAVQEPGAAAFYHPDADVLHAGSSRPVADALAAVRADADRPAPQRGRHLRAGKVH